jgi:HSP20 family protein
MSTLARRGRSDAAPGMFSRFDRLFEDWMRTMPLRMPFGANWDWTRDDIIRVDEFRDGDTQVIRADLPGIDPDKDVSVTVSDGMLRIDAERRVEKDTQDKGYTRHELRYGSLTRTLPLAEGAGDADIKASYRDGILEIRVPVPPQADRPQPTKIAIGKG